ncbi:Dienelactone hydrolase [Candidatus Kryptobacter tengchongensis]|uniref:Dienelactone hydrolase n=1 Tax=Kryptobacter tengchongensis TaxID=1643429 RepID=A0A916LKV9_KRYT1|nr:alpha/beta hydrolase [Candidatus Kryptobacter tengchongensis]CUT03483.1 Dienelactone hydrolase [Candidatus Kryptobacter tengchongensis]CUU05099.1 Dienelactone hydrolase [Candidatus Kryptobacter tengchongensis]
MKVKSKPLTLYNVSGDRITADVHFVESFLPAPVVIYSHGFLGFKDWGFIPYVAERFAENGFVFVRFNFSHNGIGENPNKITEFDKLAKNTISKQIEDLTAVIEYVFSDEFGVLNDGQLFLLGHSGGGGISIIKAVEDERVRALALWASISTFRRYSKHQIEELEKNGYIFVRVPDSVIQVKIEKIVYDDFVENSERYDIIKAISKLKIPILIVHGTADAIVPLAEAEKLRNSNPEYTKLVFISGANHLFNVKHPMEHSTDQLDKAIDETVLFFKKIIENKKAD